MENRWRTLLILHKLVCKNDDNNEIWLLNAKPESRVTPRSLADETGHSCCPRKGTVTSGNFDASCSVPRSTSLVLSGFISWWFVVICLLSIALRMSLLIISAFPLIAEIGFHFDVSSIDYTMSSSQWTDVVRLKYMIFIAFHPLSQQA